MNTIVNRLDFMCHYKLYHDRPINKWDENGLPLSRSNNGWIYTAIANALGLPVDRNYLDTKVLSECVKDRSEDGIYYWWRLPKKRFPPMSRDEVLGISSLRFFDAEMVDDFHWSWVREEYLQVPVWRQIKAAIHLALPEKVGIKKIESKWYSLKKFEFDIEWKHRNYVWQEGVTDAFPFAMKLFWHDRYYIKKMADVEPTKFEAFMFKLYIKSIIKKGSAGEKNIVWLQLHDLGMDEYKEQIDIKATLLEYFGPDHIFNNLGEKNGI